MRSALTIGLTVCALASSAVARTRQLAQPLSVRADTIQVDERTGLSLYEGHVRIVQDGLTIRAARVRVHSAHGKVISIDAVGFPVHMEDQKTGGLPLFGVAHTLHFAAAPDEVTLTGQVMFRQGTDVLHGHVVHYYVRSRRITAERGPKTRVHARIIPRTHTPKTGTAHE